MVAAGAAIGLGNIWKFPYLAYGDGGGAFVLVYIVICILLGHPIVQAEQAVGRRGRASAAASYGVIHPKWRFVRVINIICTFLIDIYYLVVSGWVLKYFVTYVVSGDFGKDKQAQFDNYISSTTQPFADACMHVCFSVGIGWGIFTTLGASMDKDANLKSDAWWVDICDTFIALLAGFVIIPTVVGTGSEMSSGPSLVLQALAC